MTDQTARCGDCKHFAFIRQGSAEKVGECRRNAPSPRNDGGPLQDAAWPHVLESQSCGEFATALAQRPAPPPPQPPVPPTDLVSETGRTRDGRMPRNTTKGGTGRRKR